MSRMWKNRKKSLCEEELFEILVDMISDWFDEEKYDMGELARMIIELLREYEL